MFEILHGDTRIVINCGYFITGLKQIFENLNHEFHNLEDKGKEIHE